MLALTTLTYRREATELYLEVLPVVDGEYLRGRAMSCSLTLTQTLALALALTPSLAPTLRLGAYRGFW